MEGVLRHVFASSRGENRVRLLRCTVAQNGLETVALASLAWLTLR